MSSQDKKLMLWLRRVIGVSTMLAGPIVLLIGLWGNNYPQWYNAISGAYWTNARTVFILMFGTMGLFHILYSGYDWIDRITNIILGLACYGLLIFPWKDGNALATEGLVQTFDIFPMLVIDSKNCFCNMAHIACGTTLLFGFAITNLFIFTRSSGVKTEKKTLRNKIYIACGIVIVAAFTMNSIIVIANHSALGNFIKLPQWIGMACEIIETASCGFSWLVKGECIPYFND